MRPVLLLFVTLACVNCRDRGDGTPVPREVIGSRVKVQRMAASRVDRKSLHRRCDSRTCSVEQECVRYPVGGKNAYSCEIRCSGGKLCPEGMDCRAIGQNHLEVCFWEDEATVEGHGSKAVPPDPLMARMTRARATALLEAARAIGGAEHRRDELRALCAATDTCAEASCREALRACAEKASCSVPAGRCGVEAVEGPALDALVEQGLVAALTRARVFLGPGEQARLDEARRRLQLPAK
jgi:hypothetical protein